MADSARPRPGGPPDRGARLVRPAPGRKEGGGGRLTATAPRDNSPKDFPDLTAREREVPDLLTTGFRHHEIGRRLGLTEKTVRNHVSAVLLKLQVADAPRPRSEPGTPGSDRADAFSVDRLGPAAQVQYAVRV